MNSMRSPFRQQQGVVLVVALIMMAVIAISSAAAIKSVTAQDLVGGNQRSQGMALQAAESALRYCEALVTRQQLTATQGTFLPKIQDAVAINYVVSDANGYPSRPKQHWETMSNWKGGNKMAFELPKSFSFDRGEATYERAPECLVERLSLGSTNTERTPPTPVSTIEAYQITVRGFSPDYAENSNGTPSNGAVVWLQSTVQQ